ncbi:hypothetical protein P8917_10015 [Bacillus atrophaeus]|uniref:hypothetical protein n=1 Tax=Bacillus atrophaeus TaxID=1452 RepID=UPI00227F6AA8|nr:hypothetical protein [Bacillus atrophaeus]MCY8497778.1 hypothetical protein [Bacillus atrophaeus]MCY8814917.1 hypothetical protein [Bacillus atrophaeus]MCY8821537.1 hypothetical protein [Bacillus atrophaeus]MCY8831011.1 hypothetical protein [Bacillus atrophaeus]MCY8835226.1 hypothetical protein [Bacillus atrophaeus]
MTQIHTEEVKKNFPKINKTAEIKIETYSTDKTDKLVRAILPEIGEVKKIIHQREPEKVHYKTYIFGSSMCVLINGGYGSGYVGTGPIAFKELLEYLNVPSAEANSAAHYEGRGTNKYQIEISF